MAPETATGNTPSALGVLRRLESGPRGLTEVEAAARLTEFGENAVPVPRAVSWPRVLLRGLRDPFTTVLLCLGAVSALVASWGTAAVILVLVAVSCVLRAIGEHRADRSMAALRELVTGTATVLRRAPDGTARAREIPVTDLVPGDVIHLAPGDLVPADVHLLKARGLTVHQSALTGESAPVPKEVAEADVAAGVERDAGAFDRPYLCSQGSGVVSGSAKAVVVGTGTRTRFAAGQGEAGAGRREAGAFDRAVRGVSWVLIRFTLLMPPLVLMAGAALDGRAPQTLPFAVAVAVGLTPAMLPVIVTVCLARGAAVLARTHDVIVKRLPALHDLGAIDVLCFDKTGTLTQDRPVLARSLGADGRDDPEALHWAGVNAWWTLQLAEVPTPDALDEAVLEATGAVGEEYDGVGAVPFDAVRRVSTAVVGGRPGTRFLVTKGAPEAVLERCALEPGERERLLALAAREADAGLRVLAVATAERPARAHARTSADERGLTFRGFLTFRDALAPTATDALRRLTSLGVTVLILTGDHPATAARTCHDLGLAPVTTRLAAEWSPAPGAHAPHTPTLVARCTPADKARLVAALRDAGHTVGFLGDGVNDVPALRAADVGVAPRGARGAARESADVVLAAKDLTALGHAITAGRCSSGAIASYLRVTLSSNFGNVLAMLAAGLLLPYLPMLPAQVLAQNLCFDAAQLAFAHDDPGTAVLGRPTVLRPPSLLRFLTGFGVLNAAADLATFGVLVLTSYGARAGDEHTVFHSAWFTENLLTQALAMVLLRTGRADPDRRRTWGPRPGPVARAAAALAAVGLLLPPGPLGRALGMTGLPTSSYLLLGVVLGLYGLSLRALTRHMSRSCTVAQRGNHC
ncbi:magnesium-translocating P-type ATPase [Streptomyces griseus]|uniref:magnesium-translocating P-type ATPase n=1 Tax=Streptomyces griseus TaxID=1911 RepID=UPI00068BC160|nr:magnesium-translocating P-type ATPase [Streptomyces griseus]